MHQPEVHDHDRASDLSPTKPESALLALFGAHVLDRDIAVLTGGVIDVLGRLSVGEHAIRATVARMTHRGLLTRTRVGRRAYLSLTPRAEEVLRDGGERLRTEVVDRQWDGKWTLLGFSVPETRRADRHALRNQLGWARFGMLQNGLWIGSSPADVTKALESIGLLDRVKVFHAEAVAPTDAEQLVREVWDLAGLADGYTKFVERWRSGHLDGLDDLTRQILLHSEWLHLIREDPRLPLTLLSSDWPGVHAEGLFRKLREQLAAPAREIADATLETLPLNELPSAG